MSEVKKTTMPDDFDISIAENLGDTEEKNTTTNTPKGQQLDFKPVEQTSINIAEDLNHDSEDNNSPENVEVNPNDTDAVTQTNVEVLADAPDMAMGNLYQNLPSSGQPSNTNVSIFEDLTHDHQEQPTNTENTTINSPQEKQFGDGSLEGVVFDNEAQMDAYFDGTVEHKDSEHLNTDEEALSNNAPDQ